MADDTTLRKNHAFYEQNASQYHERNKDTNLEDIYNAFEKALVGKNILEVGCGTGRDAAYFANKGFLVTGVDFSNEMLKIAKKECPEGTFILRDLTKGTADLGQFDGVWAMASLLHFNTEDTEKILNELGHNLGPESPLLVSLKHEDFYDSSERYFNYWEKDEAEQLFSKCGYQIQWSSNTKTERSDFSNWLLRRKS